MTLGKAHRQARVTCSNKRPRHKPYGARTHLWRCILLMFQCKPVGPHSILMYTVGMGAELSKDALRRGQTEMRYRAQVVPQALSPGHRFLAGKVDLPVVYKHIVVHRMRTPCRG